MNTVVPLLQIQKWLKEPEVSLVSQVNDWKSGPESRAAWLCTVFFPNLTATIGGGSKGTGEGPLPPSRAAPSIPAERRD